MEGASKMDGENGSLMGSPRKLVRIDVDKWRSLALPTVEAIVRATRLVTTAAVMAADYQLYHLQRNSALLRQIYSMACDNNDGGADTINKRRRLEDKIEQLERDLEQAQHEYVNSKPSSTINDGKDASDPSTLSKQTLAKRDQKEAMMNIASNLADAQEELASIDEGGSIPDSVHQRNAQRLLELCRTNGGTYIKVGQHLANLDLLLPEEFIQTLGSLFDDAPVSSYEDVCQVVNEELGAFPTELFDDFSEKPIASASLAQVHTATCKDTGRKLAIKVQHRGLRETSKGDLFAMATVVNLADKLFDDFNFMWICEEIAPQLPKELDFNNEGANAEAAAAHLASTGLDCVVPKILWNETRARVLTMEFEEGFRATDVESIEKAGINRR